MTRSKRILFCLSAWALCLLFSAVAAQAVTIEEYITPSGASSPADIAIAPDGTVWFTEINTNKIGKLIPSETQPGTSNGITEYELPEANSQPHYITVAKDGRVWFTEIMGNRIGRLDPASGEIKEFDIPTEDSEPHQIKEGPDGSIWFLEFNANKVGRLNPKDGAIKEYAVGEGHPHAMVVDGAHVWYTQGGMFWAKVFFNKVARLNAESGAFEEWTVPPQKSVPHGMTQSGDGTVWFTQMFASKLAYLDFKQGNAPEIVEFHLGERKGPHDLIVDGQRKVVWFTANRPDSIGRLDLNEAQPGTNKGVEFFPLADPKAHPSQLALDAEGNVWFTEMGMYFRGQYNNKIGKLIP